MRIIILNGNSEIAIERFNDFVPAEFKPLLEDKSTFILGAVELVNDAVEACGITILVPTEKDMIIKWIWVDPKYRSRETGATMLDDAFEIARQSMREKLIAHVPSLGEKFVYDSPFAGFFINAGFEYIDCVMLNGLRTFILTADTRMDIYYLDNHSFQSDSEMKIPELKVVNVEYFSGVPIDNKKNNDTGGKV